MPSSGWHTHVHWSLPNVCKPGPGRKLVVCHQNVQKLSGLFWKVKVGLCKNCWQLCNCTPSFIILSIWPYSCCRLPVFPVYPVFFKTFIIFVLRCAVKWKKWPELNSRIKNSHASISQALKQIKTSRRVVLTGTKDNSWSIISSRTMYYLIISDYLPLLTNNDL